MSDERTIRDPRAHWTYGEDEVSEATKLAIFQAVVQLHLKGFEIHVAVDKAKKIMAAVEAG